MVDISQFKNVLKSIWSNSQVQYLIKWIVNVFIYGALISFTATILFDFPWNPYILVGWGILFYLLKVELVDAIREMRR